MVHAGKGIVVVSVNAYDICQPKISIWLSSLRCLEGMC